MKFINLLLGIILILIIAIPVLSANDKIKDKDIISLNNSIDKEIKKIKSITYELNKKNIEYEDRTGSMIFYSGPMYADSKGTKISEAKSLKDCEFCKKIKLQIDIDPIYPVSILDYNATHIYGCFGLTDEKYKNKDIDLKVKSKKDELDIKYEQKIKIKDLTSDSPDMYCGSIPFGIDQKLKYGMNSTEIIYNSTISYNNLFGFASGISQWDTIHDASIVAYWSTIPNIYVEADGSYNAIYRNLFTFNTSMEESNIIESGSLKATVDSVDVTANDGNDFVVVVGNYTGEYPVTKDNFDDIGAINNPVEFSNRVDVSDLSVSDIIVFTLNNSGINSINKSGYSFFGVREGHDVLDDEPSGYIDLNFVGYNNIYFNLTLNYSLGNMILNITDPLTSSPISVTGGDNINITSDFYLDSNGVNVTEDVILNSIYTGLETCNLTSYLVCDGSPNSCNIYVNETICEDYNCGWLNGTISTATEDTTTYGSTMVYGSLYQSAFKHHTVYDPINNRWHTAYGNSTDNDIYWASMNASNASEWDYGLRIDAGIYRADSFDVTVHHNATNTYAHIVYANENSYIVNYKRCELTGTAPYIVCDAEQIIWQSTDATDDVAFPDIALDEDNCVMVAWAWEDDSVVTADEWNVNFVKEGSPCGDGTWSLESGFPKYRVQSETGYNAPLPVGIKSYGDKDAFLVWYNTDISTQVNLKGSFFNGTSDAFETEMNLKVDIDWGTTKAYGDLVISGETVIAFANYDSSSELRAYILDSKLDTVATQVLTGMLIDRTFARETAVSATVDTINNTIWAFGVYPAASSVDIRCMTSQDNGTTWSTPVDCLNDVASSYVSMVDANYGSNGDLLITAIDSGGNQLLSKIDHIHAGGTGGCSGTADTCDTYLTNETCTPSGCDWSTIGNFVYTEGTGWIAECTTTSSLSGYQNLIFNITYDGDSYQDTELSVINFGSVNITSPCGCPIGGDPWYINSKNCIINETCYAPSSILTIFDPYYIMFKNSVISSLSHLNGTGTIYINGTDNYINLSS